MTEPLYLNHLGEHKLVINFIPATKMLVLRDKDGKTVAVTLSSIPTEDLNELLRKPPNKKSCSS